jgi:CRISPR/Cas system-associated endonuclease/helicase Cas3
VLCIVNLKRHAFELHDELTRRDGEGLYHLSTNMCPKHREDVLQIVRERLEADKPCRLVSTQCVEAGVDLDFPTVYRAFGPLDAIAQASGRCNRGGRTETGTVHVFTPEDKRYPTRAYQQAADVTELLLKQTGWPNDISDPTLFDAYYRELYDIARPETHKKELREAIKTLDFETTAREYRLIEQDAVNLLVPYDDEVFAELKARLAKDWINRKWIADARPYSVSLFRPRDNDPVTTRIDPVEVGYRQKSDEWYLYLGAHKSQAKAEDGHCYDPSVGLVVPTTSGVLIG